MSVTAPFIYVDAPDIPEGMTVDEYRRLRSRTTRRSRPRRAPRRRSLRGLARRRRA